MATERSDKVFEYWRQASEKFDYLVTGVTGALCAYITQTFSPEKLSLSPNTLELVALLVLISSVYAGFKRIESSVETQRHSYNSLYLSEQLGQLVIKNKGESIINEATGEVFSPMDVEKMINLLTEKQPEVEKIADKSAKVAQNWYTKRNRLLSLGFMLLVAAKVWSAYI